MTNPILCYDCADGTAAARAMFVLKVWGFKNVCVLNGGMKAWGDRPTESGEAKAVEVTKLNLVYNTKLVV